MSCVWQEGNLMSPEHLFSLVPHQCPAIERTVLVLDTFCSSRISKKTHCLRHRHHIFVCLVSPDLYRFSFHTNCALIYKNHSSPFIFCCVLLRVSWGVEGHLQRIHGGVAHQPVVQQHEIYLCLSVCSCKYLNALLHFTTQFHTNGGKVKMLILMLRNIELKNFILFWVRGKALRMPKSIKYLLEESLCIKVLRKRKKSVEMLNRRFYLLCLKWAIWVWALEFLVLWAWSHLYNVYLLCLL